MKNYEEMANDVLNRINEFDEAKKKRRIKITRVATSVTPVCAIALIGVGLWKSGVLTENEQLINKNFGVTDNCTDDLFSQNNNQENMALHTEVITNSTVPDSENDTTQLQTNKNNLTSTIIDNKTQQPKGDTDSDNSKQETKMYLILRMILNNRRRKKVILTLQSVLTKLSSQMIIQQLIRNTALSIHNKKIVMWLTKICRIQALLTRD